MKVHVFLLHLPNRGTTPSLRKLSQENVNFHFIVEFLTTRADHLNVWNYQLNDMEHDFLSCKNITDCLTHNVFP